MNKIIKIALLATAGYLLPLSSFGIGEDVCDCIKVKVGSSDTISKNTYLAYKFSIKNSCNYSVWLNTGFFGYHILDLNGTPTRRLRELTFVKRYQYPEFVLIAPNAEYELKFADDPFYEFKMNRRTLYNVRLTYNNTQKKTPKKGQNYLCTKAWKRLLYVK